MLAEAGIDASDVVGIGLDVTSCTVLPVREDGVPLATLDQWRDRPHAWPKLWKHHAAQPVADRLNDVALDRGEDFLARYGGRISSEWYYPKLARLVAHGTRMSSELHGGLQGAVVSRRGSAVTRLFRRRIPGIRPA